MLFNSMNSICNEHLTLYQYDTNVLEKNLENLDMNVILRTQTLDIDFIVNFILNDKYQILESEKNIDIYDVLSFQKHIDKYKLTNEL